MIIGYGVLHIVPCSMYMAANRLCEQGCLGPRGRIPWCRCWCWLMGVLVGNGVGLVDVGLGSGGLDCTQNLPQHSGSVKPMGTIREQVGLITAGRYDLGVQL